MKNLHRFETLGSRTIKREFTREHCRCLHEWFDRSGQFRYHTPPPNSRERLWHCCSLLEEGRPRSLRLASQIILATPIDGNHFLPITAAELALHFPRRLSPAAQKHLVQAVREHYLNMLEWRFGTYGMHNFVCMTTFFLLAAPLLMERYEFPHRFASIPDVYSRDRMRDTARNALLLLLHEWEGRTVSTEFNSPTYSPIAAMALAKIVELIPDPEIRALALAIEEKHWREMLAFYHPRLGLACGPHSRAYRVDVLGQLSLSRMLLAYVGLTRERSLVGLFDEGVPDKLFHHDGDVPFNWSNAAWLLSTRYHVPTNALAELSRRRYPKRVSASIRWDSSGQINAKNRRIIPVQGKALPGGEAKVVQVQHKDWAVGYRGLSVWAHSFPIHLHYALTKKVFSMRDARSVLSAVLFQQKPQEWARDPRGQPIEAGNFNHCGRMRVKESGRDLVFEGGPLPELAALPTEECSVNTLIPTHFMPISDVRLNGQQFSGTTLKLRTRHARIEVNDHDFRYAIEYRFEKSTLVCLYRWAKFLRFAGLFHEGEKRTLSADRLSRMRVRGRLIV